MYFRLLQFFLCCLLIFAVPGGFAAEKLKDADKVEKNKEKGAGKPEASGKKKPSGKKQEKAAPMSPFDQKLLKEFDMPAKCPKLSDSQKERMEEKYDDLLELYDEIKSFYSELDALKKVEDERELRHNQGKIRKIEGRIKRSKMALVRKVRQRFRPLERKLKTQQEFKKQYEDRLAAAEKNGNKSMARKISRDYEARANQIERTQERMDILYYLLFWNFSKSGTK